MLAQLAMLTAVPAVATIRPSATVWQPFEVVLTSSAGHYKQPDVWLSLQLNATFICTTINSEGHSTTTTTLDAPGFWDGGSRWKLRFSPTVAGVWRWATSFSNSSDVGLHGRSGSFEAEVYAPSPLTHKCTRHPSSHKHTNNPPPTPCFSCSSGPIPLLIQARA